MRAIVPGKPLDSEMIARVLSTEEDLRMPPVEHGAALTAAQVDLLKRWIAQGAEYAVHWSYVKPERPDPPVCDSAERPELVPQSDRPVCAASPAAAGPDAHG